MKHLLIIFVLVGIALPAQAHTIEEYDEWEKDWKERAESGMTDRLVMEKIDMMVRHPQHSEIQAEPLVVQSSRPITEPLRQGDPGFWSSLIEIYFQEKDWAWARRVMMCESKGDPNAVNPSSGAAGLFQFMPSTWPWASEGSGWAGTSVFDPPANVATAAWLYYEIGPSQWSCK